MELEELQSRIVRLESRLRVQQAVGAIAMATLVVVLALGAEQTPSAPAALTARELTIVDAQGQRRLVLDARDEVARVEMFDGRGRQRGGIYQSGREVGLVLRNESGLPGAHIFSSSAGPTALQLYNSHGDTGAEIWAALDSSLIRMRDVGPIEPRGEEPMANPAAIAFYDIDGKVVDVLPDRAKPKVRPESTARP